LPERAEPVLVLLRERLSSALHAAHARADRVLRGLSSGRGATPPALPEAVQAFSVDHVGGRYDVCRVEPEEVPALRVHWKRPDGRPYARIETLRQGLAARGLDLLFAVNGGMYTRAWTPLGLLVEEGVVLSPLNEGTGVENYFLHPNGVFFVADSQARVVETAAYRPDHPIRLAVQSGPMLVLGGLLHPRLLPGCRDRCVRSAVGVDRGGAVLFAISDGITCFHDLATLFRDRLGCPDALYLDGSRAARMYLPQLGRFVGWETPPLATIIALSKERRTP